MSDPLDSPLFPAADFHQHLAQGRFMLLRSRAEARFMHPPRVALPGSGATDLEWVPASGEGTVYASTTVRCRPPASDYNVALIDLAEGPRLMSTVVGIAPDRVRIGMAVRARIEAGGGDGRADGGAGVPRLVFHPAADPG